MKPRELKALIKLLRSTGVVSYESEGTKLLLDPNFVSASTSKSIRVKSKAIEATDLQNQINTMVPQLTDEQWLLATNMPSDEDEQVQ